MAYQEFAEQPGFANVATVEEVIAKEGNLSIPRYVRPVLEEASANSDRDLKTVWAEFEASGREFWQQLDAVVDMLDAIADE